ncbi:hypothetical protein BFW01_g12719 [Lasiodiplodia theobromae]|nr:hypothetical protein BFW01_g12719 [Lasiodiplodia theobromae]
MTVILTTYSTWANRVLFNISKSKDEIVKRTRKMYSLEQERQSKTEEESGEGEGEEDENVASMSPTALTIFVVLTFKMPPKPTKKRAQQASKASATPKRPRKAPRGHMTATQLVREVLLDDSSLPPPPAGFGSQDTTQDVTQPPNLEAPGAHGGSSWTRIYCQIRNRTSPPGLIRFR